MSDESVEDDVDAWSQNASESASMSFPEDPSINSQIALQFVPPYLLRMDDQGMRCRLTIEKYEIPRRFHEILQKLKEFEIAIVIDDSGSMMTKLLNSRRSRWSIIRSMMKISVEIGCIFNLHGIRVYFLNKVPFLNVQDLETADQIMKRVPSGYTPLVPILRHIFTLPATRLGHDKKQLVIILTDGVPTDKNNRENLQEFEDLMRNGCQHETTFVNILVCNENHDYVQNLRSWMPTTRSFAVMDHYENELDFVRMKYGPQCRLSYGAFIMKMMIGALYQNLEFFER